MARSVQEGFDTFHGWLIPTDAQRSAGASHRSSVKSALESRLSVSNFFETGSFTHGTGVRHHSDIDVFVSLGADRPDSSYTALNWVKDALSARFPNTTVKIDRPAVKVLFGGGYETWEVIPAFITGFDTANGFVYRIPGPALGDGYMLAAPKEHLAYVNESNDSPTKGVAKRLSRLIKAWKYYRNVPISSFYLEMRCAQHVRTQTTYIDIWDVWQVLNKLNGHQLADMNDPTEVSTRFQACSSDATRADALSKLATATARARKALDAQQAGNDADAFYYLDLLFGGEFPSRLA